MRDADGDTAANDDSAGGGGDPACWSGQLCHDCGAIPDTDTDTDTARRCWRCDQPISPRDQ